MYSFLLLNIIYEFGKKYIYSGGLPNYIYSRGRRKILSLNSNLKKSLDYFLSTHFHVFSLIGIGLSFSILVESLTIFIYNIISKGRFCFFFVNISTTPKYLEIIFVFNESYLNWCSKKDMRIFYLDIIVRVKMKEEEENNLSCIFLECTITMLHK